MSNMTAQELDQAFADADDMTTDQKVTELYDMVSELHELVMGLRPLAQQFSNHPALKAMQVMRGPRIND